MPTRKSFKVNILALEFDMLVRLLSMVWFSHWSASQASLVGNFGFSLVWLGESLEGEFSRSECAMLEKRWRFVSRRLPLVIKGR
ncbi:MAG: hypothetical protein VYA34_14600 [Myxococcota bacterium]|nr:hypothetical protein [Myxococcota bacterium]